MSDWAIGTPVRDDRGVSEEQSVVATAPPKSRYSLGSSANLVRSLLAIVAMMALLYAIVPRVNSVSGPPVDVHAEAVSAAKVSGWPLVEAVGLPDGWTTTSARYVRSTSDLMTWHAGYQTPSGTYVAIEQTQAATAKWIGAQTSRATPFGTVDIAGKTWTKYLRDYKVQNSLLYTPATADELTWLVTGDAEFADMQVFIEHLQPVVP